MANKQFKAESKRLLDLMIHSIYTHKEIFLRELISNASDAIDKLYFRALSEENAGLKRDDFLIQLEMDQENRILKITDNGIGMSKADLESNLGTIAKSGSLDFKQNNDQNEEIDIIGQFGVGFYSAFMVSDTVTVVSKEFGSDQAYQWVSAGTDGYTIEECEKEFHGTEITLKIKESNEEENYDQYLETYHLRSIIKKYSDYIRYPIVMDIEKSKAKEGTGTDEKAPEYETYTERETVNSMVPIWKKSKSEVSIEDYNQFYKEKFFDYQDPAKVVYTSVEGASSYNALLFIPAKAPYNYYSKDFEKGLQLYASGVLIMDKCSDLLPDHFSFVKGLVDSQDLSLNISRELLQHDRQLKLIAKKIEEKIKNELLSMQKNDREKYEEFYKNFGLQLKYGVYEGYGANKDNLKDLILFYSSKEKKMVTMGEYLQRMKEDQQFIYYATGESVERLDKLPQTELLRDKDIEILYMTDDIDEFAVKILHDYNEKEFKSVAEADLGLESEEEKDAAKKQSEGSKELLDFMKESLGDKVSEVKLSQRLKSHPVCLSASGELSLEMEKVLNSMPSDNKVKADRVLEINANHTIFQTLTALYKDDQEKLKKYATLLYTQALLIEGIDIEDPVAFSNTICELM